VSWLDEEREALGIFGLAQHASGSIDAGKAI